MLHRYILSATLETNVHRYENPSLTAELLFGAGALLRFRYQRQLVLSSARDSTKQELQRRELLALANEFASHQFVSSLV